MPRYDVHIDAYHFKCCVADHIRAVEGRRVHASQVRVQARQLEQACRALATDQPELAGYTFGHAYYYEGVLPPWAEAQRLSKEARYHDALRRGKVKVRTSRVNARDPKIGGHVKTAAIELGRALGIDELLPRLQTRVDELQAS